MQRRMSVLLSALVLSVSVAFVPMTASAACCGCGMCWMKNYTRCFCAGEMGCPRCFSDITLDIQQSVERVSLAIPVMLQPVCQG
jgi:protein-arginine kinase activator protein McsA